MLNYIYSNYFLSFFFFAKVIWPLVSVRLAPLLLVLDQLASQPHSLLFVHQGTTTRQILLDTNLSSTIFLFYRLPLLILARFATGFAEGVTYPCVQTLLPRWIPGSERSLLRKTREKKTQKNNMSNLSLSFFFFSV